MSRSKKWTSSLKVGKLDIFEQLCIHNFNSKKGFVKSHTLSVKLFKKLRGTYENVWLIPFSFYLEDPVKKRVLGNDQTFSSRCWWDCKHSQKCRKRQRQSFLHPRLFVSLQITFSTKSKILANISSENRLLFHQIETLNVPPYQKLFLWLFVSEEHKQTSFFTA